MTERIIWRGDDSSAAQPVGLPDFDDAADRSASFAAKTFGPDYQASAAVARMLYPGAQTGRGLQERAWLAFVLGPGVLDEAAAVIEYFAQDNEL